MQPKKDPHNFTLIGLEWSDGDCPFRSYQILKEPIQDGTGRWFWFEGEVEVSEVTETEAWICIPDLRLEDRALQTFVREDVMQVFCKDCEIRVTALSLTAQGQVHHTHPYKLHNFLKGLVDGKTE